jgi:hypothetical protein
MPYYKCYSCKTFNQHNAIFCELTLNERVCKQCAIVYIISEDGTTKQKARYSDNIEGIEGKNESSEDERRRSEGGELDVP